LVKKSSHGARHFLGPFHEKLMSGISDAELLRIPERRLHTRSGSCVFTVGLSTE
jgi:hypothetical protein